RVCGFQSFGAVVNRSARHVAKAPVVVGDEATTGLEPVQRSGREIPYLQEDRPRLLDLFCGAGGAAVGYHRAGFDVVGVDIRPQPNYPFEFIEADAFPALRYYVDGRSIEEGRPWDAIHASPPCQAFSAYQRRGHGVGDFYP